MNALWIKLLHEATTCNYLHALAEFMSPDMWRTSPWRDWLVLCLPAVRLTVCEVEQQSTCFSDRHIVHGFSEKNVVSNILR